MVIAVADSLQELERRAVLIGFKLCQARLDAYFVQKVSFLLWPSDLDAVDDTDHIIHIIDVAFCRCPRRGNTFGWLTLICRCIAA